VRHAFVYMKVTSFLSINASTTFLNAENKEYRQRCAQLKIELNERKKKFFILLINFFFVCSILHAMYWKHKLSDCFFLLQHNYIPFYIYSFFTLIHCAVHFHWRPASTSELFYSITLLPLFLFFRLHTCHIMPCLSNIKKVLIWVFFRTIKCVPISLHTQFFSLLFYFSSEQQL
jgi:hypothetical protein